MTETHTGTTGSAAPAIQAEAVKSAEHKRLTLAGEEYLLPPSSEDWSLETMEAFEEGKVVSAVRSLLGAEQWQRLKATGATLSDLNKLAEQIATAYGFDNAGE
ncbi:hypothetical protein HNR23_003785 [Nocardiopsis mwathae]|uniref:Tail assembly chaperone n=1 Tax=Nocardiopsis mwathae TaxID=1472723 RepID=A0A7W9YK95_9ACTN|nr:hypothetical protein [Nocardiopsis mwathae]MBB6173725.1 hypothetical protein [Nocardiopsis mwathae]